MVRQNNLELKENVCLIKNPTTVFKGLDRQSSKSTIFNRKWKTYLYNTFLLYGGCHFPSSFEIAPVLTGSWYLVQRQATHSVTLPLLRNYIKPRVIMPIFMIIPLHHHQQMLVCGMFPVNHWCHNHTPYTHT